MDLSHNCHLGKIIRRRTVAAVGVAALLLGGCADSSEAPAAEPTVASVTTTTPVPTTASVAAIPSSAALPMGKYLRLGPGTVSNGCSHDLDRGDDLKFGKGQVFIPALGKNVNRPTPSIPAGMTVVNWACAVVGDEDVIRVIHVYTLRTPSSGLTPETFDTRIVSFDPSNPDAPAATAAWPEDAGVRNFEHFMPTRWGLMAYGNGGVMGFDLHTLKRTWKSNAAVEAANSEGFVTAKVGAAGRDSFDWTFRIHSAKDGAEIVKDVGPTMGYGIDDFRYGFGLERGTYWEGKNDYYYFDMRDGQFKGPIPSGGIFWGNIYLAYNNGIRRPFISIWDMDKGQEIFSREGKDVAGLNIESLYVAGNYLYIKNDSDSPVVDISTGQTVSSGWKVRPANVINRDWMLVVGGSTTNVAPSCFSYDGQLFSCGSDKATLVHAPGGNYPGPWF